MQTSESKAPVALITGAGIGIGAATARAFAEAGYRVAVTDVLDAEGTAVARALETENGIAEFFHLDVADTGQVDEVVRSVGNLWQPPEVIVANAGIARRVPFEELADDVWDRLLDVDLKGVMRVFRSAAPAMRERRRGSLIALSSIMGVSYGWSEHAHYSAAKAGVVGLVRALAVELASDNVRVNGIAPGYVRTAQSLSRENSLGPEGLEAAASFIPLGRVGSPEEIAPVAVFLASDDARYITGQVLLVDGGLTVGRY